MATEFEDGRAAARAGVSRSANPYSMTTQAASRKQWDEGWTAGGRGKASVGGRGPAPSDGFGIAADAMVKDRR